MLDDASLRAVAVHCKQLAFLTNTDINVLIEVLRKVSGEYLSFKLKDMVNEEMAKPLTGTGLKQGGSDKVGISLAEKVAIEQKMKRIVDVVGRY